MKAPMVVEEVLVERGSSGLLVLHLEAAQQGTDAVLVALSPFYARRLLLALEAALNPDAPQPWDGKRCQVHKCGAQFDHQGRCKGNLRHPWKDTVAAQLRWDRQLAARRGRKP